jgi:hypothetical protein
VINITLFIWTSPVHLTYYTILLNTQLLLRFSTSSYSWALFSDWLQILLRQIRPRTYLAPEICNLSYYPAPVLYISTEQLSLVDSASYLKEVAYTPLYMLILSQYAESTYVRWLSTTPLMHSGEWYTVKVSWLYLVKIRPPHHRVASNSLSLVDPTHSYLSYVRS